MERTESMDEVASFKAASGQGQYNDCTTAVRAVKGWAVPLSFQSFQERIALLAELELPCVFYLGSPSYDRIRSGTIRRIERRSDRLSLMGGDFALFLNWKNIDSIWLVQREEVGDKSLAVEIYGRNGEIIARILGRADSLGYAVWHDIMGNPSFAIA